jgi:hypothetical protein
MARLVDSFGSDDSCSLSVLFRIYPFLAVTHRVNSNVLVVEGWVYEYAIQAAVDEFQAVVIRRWTNRRKWRLFE